VRHGRIDRARVRAMACGALERVGLDVDPTVPVRLLGIAQQQLVEIAKALAKESSILVLDEPTAALAAGDTARLLASLGDLRRRGVASILVSHRLDEVFQVADRITVLRDGRSIATAATGELPRERVIALMVGREIGELYPHVAPPQPHVRLAVRDWAVEDAAKPGRDAVADVGFDLHAGEILAIAGLVGAGRTALLTSLYGAARARVDGTLELEGGPPRPPFRHPAAALAAGIALVTEDRKRHGLIAGASVADNIALAGLAAFVRRGVIDTAARDRACAAGLARVQAAVPDPGVRVAQLSGGNQQKVVLGRALLGNPRILLLDEPTRGIDVGAKSEIYRAIADLAAAGMAILLVTSELPELLALAHRILVLNQGRPAALLDARRATAASVMHAATRSEVAGVPAASGEVA
jgi:D-xylose transport system ATP-binding protein